jgi:hypothetical protein
MLTFTQECFKEDKGMKRYISILLLLSLIALTGIMYGSRDTVKAAVQTSYEELKITKVSDIDVYNNYQINYLNIDNAIYPYYDTRIYKFTLEQDGFVKLLLTADGLSKTTYSSSKYTEQDPILTATVYRDEKLLFEVIPTITAKGNTSSTKASVNGETKGKVALDRGTYYVAIRTDKLQQSSKVTTYVKGQSEFILYYQPVISDEIFRPSSVGYENPVKSEKASLGLLTVANPKDYYTFDIKERSLISIKYMYESAMKAKFILYGKDRDVQLTKQFIGNSVRNHEELLLEAGKYYISLESLTVGDGGQTSIQVSSIPYLLELSQVNRSQNSYIEVETIEVPKEVRYLRGKLSQEDINNSKWKTAQVITEKLQFGVNKAGNYSVRVVDDKGNMFIETIKISVCDSTAPSKPKITGYEAGGYEVKGTAEKNSIVTVVYNNKLYTCTANKEGKYSCVLAIRLNKGAKVEVYATDISGNISVSSVVAVK